jgi:dephospho-CoA kinase
MDRDGISRQQAEERIGAQMSQQVKLEFADFAVDTSEGFEETRRRTEKVYRQLRVLADTKTQVISPR